MNLIRGFWGTLAALALLAVPTALCAQVAQQFGGPGGTYATWGSPPPNSSPVDVTYFINPATVTNPAQVTLINQAAAAWSSSGGDVRLVSAGPGAQITITAAALGVTPGTVSPVVPAGTLPGPGTYPDGRAWFPITGPVTITFNNVLPFWDGTGAPPSPFAVDQTAVSLDLLGQALGLGFAAPSDTTSVMQPNSNIPFGAPGNDSLSSTDIQGISAVYGTPEPATLGMLGAGLAVLGLTGFLRRATLGV